jgi:hypothetical protein
MFAVDSISRLVYNLTMNRFWATGVWIPGNITLKRSLAAWCQDNISLRGDRWDVEFGYGKTNPNDVDRAGFKFIFEHLEDKVQFVLANSQHL